MFNLLYTYSRKTQVEKRHNIQAIISINFPLVEVGREYAGEYVIPSICVD